MGIVVKMNGDGTRINELSTGDLTEFRGALEALFCQSADAVKLDELLSTTRRIMDIVDDLQVEAGKAGTSLDQIKLDQAKLIAQIEQLNTNSIPKNDPRLTALLAQMRTNNGTAAEIDAAVENDTVPPPPVDPGTGGGPE